MLEDIRIVCFGSGDFPIETFEYLVESYNVVGFVTSKDKPVFGNKRVYDIAMENGIPVCIPDNLESKEFLQWLDEVDGNTFCVISYKYLPKCVRSKAEYAFNIHASLLPLLRGAAPINWALRYGFTHTGITAIKLADKIDTGAIIKSYKEDIRDDDNYETLFKRLSRLSVTMTDLIMTDIEDGCFTTNVAQQIVPKELDSPVFHAPKLTQENTTYHHYEYGNLALPTAKDIHNFIRSLSPNIGATFSLSMRKFNGVDIDNIKDFTFKVYESELINKGEEWVDEHYNGSDIITDWKTYLYIIPFVSPGEVVSVKKIQMPGKRILDVNEFLKGFQVYNKKEYIFQLN